jgi:lysylphosphatidylglycerol synthetase-like protein (DUF2156 family)
VATLARVVLTFVAVADTLLAAQAALIHRYQHRHQHYSSAGEAALGVLGSAHVLGALFLAASVLYLATRPKRAFHRILMMLTLVAAFLATSASQPGLLAIAAIVGVAAALAASLWPEVGDPLASRLGCVLLLAGTGITAWLFLLENPNRRMVWLFTALMLVAFSAMLSAVALLDRNPPLPTRRDEAAARRLYQVYAGTGAAPFALMDDKRHFWASDHRAFVSLGCRAGVALAMGPAIGEPDAVKRLYAELRGACRLRGWRLAYYQVDECTSVELGTARVGIGSEALVAIDALRLDSPALAKVRRMVARAGRSGVRAETVPEAELDHRSRTAMDELATAAAARSPLGEMAFSVGRRGQPRGVERMVGLAWAADGRLLAYTTWLSLPAPSLVVLDELKRAPGAPPGTVELLLSSSLEAFRGRAARASLGLAPLLGSRMPWLPGGRLAEALGLGALSSGLAPFKAKFGPSWERRYLVVERLTDLPTVLLATFLLHYPDIGHPGARLAIERQA